MNRSLFNQNRLSNAALLALRLVAGLLFFQAGAMKLFGWYGGMPGGASLTLLSQIGIGAILEVVGGIAIMAGAFTRPVAFILCGEMAVAYWQFHFPQGHWPVQNNGNPAVLFCFIFLFFAAHGAGPLSVDGWLRSRRQKPASSSDPASGSGTFAAST